MPKGKKPANKEQSPLDYLFREIGGHWKPRILGLLGNGPLRYRTIMNEVGNISDTILSKALRELVDDGLVLRIGYREAVPHVEYALTEKGKSALELLRTACRWACLYHAEVLENTPAQCRACSLRQSSSEECTSLSLLLDSDLLT